MQKKYNTKNIMKYVKHWTFSKIEQKLQNFIFFRILTKNLFFINVKHIRKFKKSCKS